ncbi:MAG: ABC transporter substrate-binding protein, partial [Acidimicrobiales bacterium]
MGVRRGVRAGALCTVLGLTVLACGSDGDGDAAAPTTAGGGAATSAAGATSASFGPSKDNPKIILGPEGYKIDTSKCPAGWKDTEGVTDAEIKLAHTFVFSGNLAANGGISLGIKAYLEHVNATEGGIKGKKFSFTAKDDGYEPARMKSNTDELLETVRPVAMPAMAGTPGNLATYDKLNEQCMPDLLVGSGHPAFADPINHPWVTNSYLLYPPEGAILAEYIAKTFGKGTTVGAIVLNNDFGAAYRSGFEKKAKEVGISLVKAELFDATAATVTNELTTVASANADVYVIMSAGATCTQGINALATSSWKPKGKVITSTCTGNFLTAAGAAAGDFVGSYWRKDTSDGPTYANDPDALKARDILKKAGLDENEFNNNYGIWWAMPLVQIMKNAAELPGGVTKTNIMLASYSLKFDHPLNLGTGANRIKFEMNGLKDVAYTEGA